MLENSPPYIRIRFFWSTLPGAVLLRVAKAVDIAVPWSILHCHHCESQSTTAFCLARTVGLTLRHYFSWPFTGHEGFGVFTFFR